MMNIDASIEQTMNIDQKANHNSVASLCDIEIKCLYCSMKGQNSPVNRKKIDRSAQIDSVSRLTLGLNNLF